SVLAGKASLLDEISGRAWPSVFTVAALLFGSLGSATKWLVPNLKNADSLVSWFSHTSDAIGGLTWLTRWRHVEFTIEKLASPLLGREASASLARAFGGLGRNLKAINPGLAEGLQSSG